MAMVKVAAGIAAEARAVRAWRSAQARLAALQSERIPGLVQAGLEREIAAADAACDAAYEATEGWPRWTAYQLIHEAHIVAAAEAAADALIAAEVAAEKARKGGAI